MNLTVFLMLKEKKLSYEKSKCPQVLSFIVYRFVFIHDINF